MPGGYGPKGKKKKATPRSKGKPSPMMKKRIKAMSKNKRKT